MAPRARAGSLAFIVSRSRSRWLYFRGTLLRPVPSGESKQKEVRYLDIREDDQFDKLNSPIG